MCTGNPGNHPGRQCNKGNGCAQKRFAAVATIGRWLQNEKAVAIIAYVRVIWSSEDQKWRLLRFPWQVERTHLQVLDSRSW